MRNAAKVLIVDDDKSSSQMLSEVVKRMGLKPIVANKPVDALNVVKLQTVHAALVDVLLPKMSGVDLVMEFRKTKFGDNPVVLLSGVFKDKTFAADAVKKTGAADFLFKPFGAEELMNSLKSAFKDALSVEKWNVQSLLTRKMPSSRERAKAIEHLEAIHGNDFPYVLGLLLEVSISGHLNIVNEAGEIFGVTVTKGMITDVDSTESQSAGVLAMITNGFLNQQDWDEFQQAGNKKFTLDKLVQEGYVSPHAVAVAKHEQILSDLKAICSAESLRVNFGPADTDESLPKHAVEMVELLTAICLSIDEYFKPDYLTGFYSGVLKSPIQIANGHDKLELRWKEPMFAEMTKLKEIIKRGGTIAQVLDAEPDKATQIYQAVHYLVLHRDILFDDIERAKDLTASLERYKKIFAELSERTADTIFEYFGAPPMASPKVVETLFDEYSKSNGPDRLPREASPELIEVCQKCFELIKAAKVIMTSDFMRQELMTKKKSDGAEKQKKSNEMVARGLELLRKGQFAQAVDTLKDAEKLHTSSLSFMIRIWAENKAGVGLGKPQLLETLRRMESLPPDDRKSAYYFMAMGLVKKALGDPMAASFFEKAIAADTTFTEARRELNVLGAVAKEPKDKKVDLLTGDISQVISNLFRRKAD